MNKAGASYGERDRCPVYTAIRVIEGRWKPMIIRRLGEADLVFGELRRTMPGVTIKVLRQHLRQLDADGVMTRSVEQRPALRVRYRLTQHGRTLGPVFESLWAWGVVHLARLENGKISGLDTDVRFDPAGGFVSHGVFAQRRNVKRSSGVAFVHQCWSCSSAVFSRRMPACRAAVLAFRSPARTCAERAG